MCVARLNAAKRENTAPFFPFLPPNEGFGLTHPHPGRPLRSLEDSRRNLETAAHYMALRIDCRAVVFPMESREAD
jgi:hypothetical protein